MTENSDSIENKNERIPNEREVLNQIESIVDGDFEIVRNLKDEQGLYMLSVESKDESGDTVLHTYMRVGNNPEGFSNETIIEAVYYVGDIPKGGRTVMKYENGVWVKETR